MKIAPLKDDFVESLLAQDSFFSSPDLAEHRRRVIERLGLAREREKRARKFVLAAAAAAFAIISVLFAAAAFEIMHTSAWPNWLQTILVMVVILTPLTTGILICLYLFRYRWELVRARKAAREQALAEIPRQINQLRQELAELRKQTGGNDRQTGGGSEKGFTLMELLVVIAVLAILASLLLPALANGVARTRITTCKNNLGQMGKALAMYEGDFRYFPGAGNDLTRISQPPWWVLAPECWLAKITPYLATNSPIFVCPDYKPIETNSKSYGYNAGGSCQLNYPPYNLGLGLGEGFGFIAPASIAAPADMISLGDLQLPISVARFVISPWHKQLLGSLDSVIPTRHAGGSDMAFLDCHVEWLKRPRWIDENSPARLRWNNDHQPHPETW